MKLSDFDHVAWLKPWQKISEHGRDAYNLELLSELSIEHKLYGIKATAVARTCTGDDVLFLIDHPTFPMAVVHLTFTGKQEISGAWPTFEVYRNQRQWIEQRMIPDSVHYQNKRLRRSA